MKGLRKAYRGEGGFTLVELLVVVVILGVLAAVATLAVTKFIGSGNVEAANTELHQAQTAITAALADAGAATIGVAPGTATAADAWKGQAGVVLATGSASGSNGDAATYLMGPFKAGYSVSASGAITYGLVNATGGWKGVVWGTTSWIKG